MDFLPKTKGGRVRNGAQLDGMENQKTIYKKIRSIQRQPRKVELINLIINLKSNYLGNAYHNADFRTQLRYLLMGSKSWSGDVLYYFLWRFDVMVAKPSHIRRYYGVSKSEY